MSLPNLIKFANKYSICYESHHVANNIVKF